MEHIEDIYETIVKNWHVIYNYNFQLGCIVGAILLFLLIIVLKILFYMLRYQHKCNGILINGPEGEVFISAAALFDLIKSLEEEFVGTKINKITLLKNGKNYILKIAANLTDFGASFPNIVNTIREKILLSAKEVFGIENIVKIDIKLKRIKN